MTYFIDFLAYYQQTHGAAMGSPISPLVANCFMEQFDKSTISTAPNHRHCGYDTWTTHSPYFTNMEAFTEHTNSIDPHITFTILHEHGRVH